MKICQKLISIVCIIFLLGGTTVICNSALAQAITDDVNQAEDDDSLEGFKDEEDNTAGFEEDDAFTDIKVDVKAIESETGKSSIFSFGGFFKEEIAYSYAHEEVEYRDNYDKPDFYKIRSTLNLSFDLDLPAKWKAKLNWNGFYDYAYTRIGRDDFSDETLETYESESEIRDFFIDGGLTDWFRIKIGRQIIAWGQSESTQLNDMANPRDSRELGMVDIEDARIPVTATKLSFLFGSWETNLVAIHEIRGDKIGGAGSEFDALQSLRALGITIKDEEIPENEADNTEYLVRLFKSFNGGDVSLIWSDVYDDSFYLDLYSAQLLSLPPDSAIALTLIPRHKRIKTFGFSGNLVSGSWLFRTEIVRKIGKAIAREQSDLLNQLQVLFADLSTTVLTEDDGAKSWSEKDTTQVMFGFDYSGIDDLTITFEAVGEKIENYEKNLSDSETGVELAAQITYSALNDTFEANLVWVNLRGSNGDIVRLNVDYDIVDALTVSGGFIVYEASDEEATLYAFRNNDRTFASLKYSF